MKKNIIYKLHQKHTQGLHPQKWLELVWTHSNIVLEISLQLAQSLMEKTEIRINKKSLTQGALVHDIGVYYCYDKEFNPNTKLPPYLHHGFIGFDLLKKEKFSEEICRYAITHPATGLTKEDIERENLPYKKQNYIPVSLEEELLCYADKFHTKYPSFSTFDEQIERLEKFDPDRKVKMETFKNKFGLPNLTNIRKKYGRWNQVFNAWIKTI